MKRISLKRISLAMVFLSAQVTLGDDHPERWLPLRVNNLWTGHHRYYDITQDYFGTETEPLDRTEWTEWLQTNGAFTLKVERTEVLDDKTWYVISDLPEKWPPVPEFFIAGKKLRWEGASLMEHTADGEQPLFIFGLAHGSEYEVTDKDRQIIPVVFDHDRFVFQGGAEDAAPLVNPSLETSFYFLPDFGLRYCNMGMMSDDGGLAGKAAKPASPTPIFENSITMDHAIIDNEYVDHWMQTVKQSGAVTPPDSVWIEAVGEDYVDLAWTMVSYVFWYHVWAEIKLEPNKKHWLWMTRVSDWWAVDGIVRARVYMHPDANPTGWAVTSSYGTIESEMAHATPLVDTITGIEPTSWGTLKRLRRD